MVFSCSAYKARKTRNTSTVTENLLNDTTKVAFGTGNITDQYFALLYIELTISFLIGWKHTVKFSKSAPATSSSCRLYNYHVKDTQGHR